MNRIAEINEKIQKEQAEFGALFQERLEKHHQNMRAQGRPVFHFRDKPNGNGREYIIEHTERKDEEGKDPVTIFTDAEGNIINDVKALGWNI